MLGDASANAYDKAHAANALGMFAEANDANKAAVVEAGATPPLVDLLHGGSDEGKMEAAVVLLYLAAVNPTAVVAADPIPRLVELLSSGLEQGRII